MRRHPRPEAARHLESERVILRSRPATTARFKTRIGIAVHVIQDQLWILHPTLLQLLLQLPVPLPLLLLQLLVPRADVAVHRDSSTTRSRYEHHDTTACTEKQGQHDGQCISTKEIVSV